MEHPLCSRSSNKKGECSTEVRECANGTEVTVLSDGARKPVQTSIAGGFILFYGDGDCRSYLTFSAAFIETCVRNWLVWVVICTCSSCPCIHQVTDRRTYRVYTTTALFIDRWGSTFLESRSTLYLCCHQSSHRTALLCTRTLLKTSSASTTVPDEDPPHVQCMWSCCRLMRASVSQTSR